MKCRQRENFTEINMTVSVLHKSHWLQQFESISGCRFPVKTSFCFKISPPWGISWKQFSPSDVSSICTGCVEVWTSQELNICSCLTDHITMELTNPGLSDFAINAAQSAHHSTTGEGTRIALKGPGINMFRQDPHFASAAGFWDTIFTRDRGSGVFLTGLRTNHGLHTSSLPMMQWWRRPASM